VDLVSRAALLKTANGHDFSEIAWLGVTYQAGDSRLTWFGEIWIAKSLI
jgi:hypothetical protein